MTERERQADALRMAMVNYANELALRFGIPGCPEDAWGELTALKQGMFLAMRDEAETIFAPVEVV